jgi:CRISPR-associated protein Cas2
MNAVVVYDISCNRRRNRLRKFLKELGIRSQKSVFECRLLRHEIPEIRQYCRDHLDLEEDSVRLYRICESCISKAVIQGKGVRLANLDWEIV